MSNTNSQVMGVNGNYGYKRIHASAPNAQDGQIALSSFDFPSGHQQTVAFTLDTGTLAGGSNLTAGGGFPIMQLPLGAVVTSASVNGNQSVFPGNFNQYTFGFASSATGFVSVANQFIANMSGTSTTNGGIVASPPTATVGSTINGSILHVFSAPLPSMPGFQYVIVGTPIVGTTSPGGTADYGNINFKFTYYLP